MNYNQRQVFYKKDEHKYIVKENHKFLAWYNRRIDEGYSCYIKLDEIQELIDNLATWYNLKYPERELDYYDGIYYTNFTDIRSISKYMDFRQLLFRLPDHQSSLIECEYRARGWGNSAIKENGQIVGYKPQIFMTINKKNYKKPESVFDYSQGMPFIIIDADPKTGVVEQHSEIRKYINNKYINKYKNMTIEQLLLILEARCNDVLEFEEIKQTVYDHNIDLELRNKVLQLVAIKLLYSKNTIPEFGYERAKRFINEFNKKLNINLTTQKIDEIMNRNYDQDEKEEEQIVTIEEPKVKQKKLFERLFNKDN